MKKNILIGLLFGIGMEILCSVIFVNVLNSVAGIGIGIAFGVSFGTSFSLIFKNIKDNNDKKK